MTGRSSDPDFSTHYATVKYDSAGPELWVARYYGPGNYQDIRTAIAVDKSGNVYVTGSTWGLDTDYDYITAKYNSAGQQVGLHAMPGLSAVVIISEPSPLTVPTFT